MLTPLAKPRLHETVFITDQVTLLGDVEMGAHSSVWFGSVIRGDVHSIKIGDRTNIQDACVLHVTKGKFPLTLADDITLGHRVTLHGCTVHSRVLIGIGAIVLDGAEISSDSVIAAGSLVTEGFKVPSGVLMMGAPAKIKRELNRQEIDFIKVSADNYVKYQDLYPQYKNRGKTFVK